MKPTYFTRDYPVYYVTNGKIHMLLYWDGYDADFPFVYYVQPSNAFGEQDHHKVIKCPCGLGSIRN